jgi:hypothetical protein
MLACPSAIHTRGGHECNCHRGHVVNVSGNGGLTRDTCRRSGNRRVVDSVRSRHPQRTRNDARQQCDCAVQYHIHESHIPSPHPTSPIQRLQYHMSHLSGWTQRQHLPHLHVAISPSSPHQWTFSHENGLSQWSVAREAKEREHLQASHSVRLLHLVRRLPRIGSIDYRSRRCWRVRCSLLEYVECVLTHPQEEYDPCSPLFHEFDRVRECVGTNGSEGDLVDV